MNVKYVATDGKEFTDRAKCEEYEKSINNRLEQQKKDANAILDIIEERDKIDERLNKAMDDFEKKYGTMAIMLIPIITGR